MQKNNEDIQLSLFDLDSEFGKMYPEPFPAQTVKTSRLSSRSSSVLKNHTFMLLDLRPGAGNMLGPCWEYDPVWLGPPGTLNTSECPKDVVGSSLSRILQAIVHSKYYLSRKACLGILRRSKERGKPLPPLLELALKIQAGLKTIKEYLSEKIGAFHINQRDEGIDLGDKSGALMATSNMQMQTFVTEPVTAGFLAESSATAGDIGYQEECAPTLKAGGKSGAILCLNDQGGQQLDCSEDVTGTLRAQEHGHQPLIFENHGIDSRYTGPYQVSPSVTASFGEGGNNVHFVADGETICIMGNAIDRKPHNGGNGIGVSKEVAYTLTATDHHAVFSRMRTDVFMPDNIASTESARQGKDATDLILEDKEPLEPYPRLIRRLTPLECERLQGYPDGWTDLPGASDSARYKALGNSVAIPCVELLMLGISLVLEYESNWYALSFT